jgi:hypothetical protein
MAEKPDDPARRDRAVRAEAGGTRRLLEQLGPGRWDEVGIVTDATIFSPANGDKYRLNEFS